ncbi:hypothetical protein ACWEU6_12840 [Streptosporangium sandarakinum]|uniref:hypothetical protein n=1 Tax=Streptosporangium sandarakinum TaxID=1260955 RepID=UPI0036C7AB24
MTDLTPAGDPVVRIFTRVAAIKADVLQFNTSRAEDVTAGDFATGDIITRLGDIEFPFTLTAVQPVASYDVTLTASHGWFTPGPVEPARPVIRLVLTSPYVFSGSAFCEAANRAAGFRP